jgi:hypothetical protein
VHHPRHEACARGQRPQRVLVGGVAGVDDPVAVREVRQAEVPVARRHPDAPLEVPQRQHLVVVAPLRRRLVVVVDEGEVDLVAGEQVEGLERLVLVDAHVDARVRPPQVVDGRQQRAADRGGEPGHPQDPGGLGGRIQVEPRGLHRGEDRDGVVGEAPPCRGQPHPTAVRLQQRGADVTGQSGDPLGHARGRRAEGVRDLAHRPQSRELEQHPEPAYVHPRIVSM